MRNQALFLAFALFAALPAIAEEKPPKESEKPEAPKAKADPALDFTLVDCDGKKRTLSEFKGKIIILEWINHGCPFVKKHYVSKNMQKLQEKYTKAGAVWLSICSSSEGKQGYYTAEDFKKKTKEIGAVPTAVLLDTSGKVGQLYKAKTTPQICVIDKNFHRVYDGAIDDKRSANPEDVKTSKNYVAAVMDALLAGKPSPLRRTKPYGCSVKYATP